MKIRLILTIAVVTGLLALIAAGYCFWLMDNPLSYKWVPVVITGFLLSIFVFIASSITSFVLVIRLRRSSHASNLRSQPDDLVSRINR